MTDLADPTGPTTAPGPARDEAFELRTAAAAHGALTWREAGRGPALVLLHGIGSGAASFDAQLAAFAGDHRVIAWDAPGYGASAPLPSPRPLAGDYADALVALLRGLGVADDVALVGHSLGAIVAAAAAARLGAAVRALVLVSPARGYAGAAPEVRAQKWRERVELVERLGVDALAATRSAGLCAPGARPDAIEAVRRNMARITPRGYAQAAHMLAHDDLLVHARAARAPVSVLVGEHDRVTPPDACRDVARALGAPLTTLAGVGHASCVEDADGFNRALRAALAGPAGAAPATTPQEGSR